MTKMMRIYPLIRPIPFIQENIFFFNLEETFFFMSVRNFKRKNGIGRAARTKHIDFTHSQSEKETIRYTCVYHEEL